MVQFLSMRVNAVLDPRLDFLKHQQKTCACDLVGRQIQKQKKSEDPWNIPICAHAAPVIPEIS